MDAVGLPAVNGSQLTSVTGTDATKLAIASNLSDLNNATTARTNLGLGTAATQTFGTGANNLVQLTAASKLPAVDGSLLTNVVSTDATKLAIANNLSDLNNVGTARTNLGLGTAAVKDHGTSNGDLVILDAVGLPALNGSQLTSVTGTDATKLAIANNLSDLNNATTARTNLGLGTAATQTFGTGANNLVQLTAASKLPAVDGSLLTNLPSSGGGLTYAAKTTASHSPLTPAADYHYSINADSATFVVNLPALSSLTDGQQIRFKLQARGNSAYDVTINRAGSDTIDGATSQTLDVTYSSITLVVGSTEWEIV